MLGRGWDRNGRLQPAVALLDGVDTRWEGDSDRAQWQLATDRRGTVVVASTRHDGTLVARIRDPGGAFGPTQEVADGLERDADLEVSPIAPDGTVTQQWGRHAENGAGARGADQTAEVTRTGRAAAFSAPQPPGTTPVPADAPATLRLAHSESARVARSVLARCPTRACFARLLRWGGRRAGWSCSGGTAAASSRGHAATGCSTIPSPSRPPSASA